VVAASLRRRRGAPEPIASPARLATGGYGLTVATRAGARDGGLTKFELVTEVWSPPARARETEGRATRFHSTRAASPPARARETEGAERITRRRGWVATRAGARDGR
jgi:hypothetical protein